LFVRGLSYSRKANAPIATRAYREIGRAGKAKVFLAMR